MAKHEERVLCQTPTFGKKGTSIPRWKFEFVRANILKNVPKNVRGIEFRELIAALKGSISQADQKRIGSLEWHAVTVKLHLEVIGELQRLNGAKPQRIRRIQ